MTIKLRINIKFWLQFLAFQAIAIYLTGCLDHAAKSTFKHELGLKSYNDDELAQILVPGITKNQIIKQFGMPPIMWEREGIEIWTYVFEMDNYNIKNVVRTSGFQAVIKGDKLLRWEPVSQVLK